mmetsp:Transcript_12559/g.18984  ORF Transcript_12559/g.18984 Transcript_12559/m.18984 type:complete len:508 (-) Transcript_12559:67-1590(-)
MASDYNGDDLLSAYNGQFLFSPGGADRFLYTSPPHRLGMRVSPRRRASNVSNPSNLPKGLTPLREGTLEELIAIENAEFTNNANASPARPLLASQENGSSSSSSPPSVSSGSSSTSVNNLSLPPQRATGRSLDSSEELQVFTNNIYAKRTAPPRSSPFKTGWNVKAAKDSPHLQQKGVAPIAVNCTAQTLQGAGRGRGKRRSPPPTSNPFMAAQQPPPKRTRRRRRSTTDDDPDFVPAAGGGVSRRRRTSRGRKGRTTSTSTKAGSTTGAQGPSSKSAVRLFALSLMFNQWLPDEKPPLLTKEYWKVFKIMRSQGSLVQVVCVSSEKESIVVRLPSMFDCLVHSRANYSAQFSHWKPNNKTRFRFWSDWKGVQDNFAPVYNRNCADDDQQLKKIHELAQQHGIPDLDFIERTISYFPLANAPLLHQLQKNTTQGEKNPALCRELGAFFQTLFERYLHPKDRELLDQEGLGRTRKKPSWHVKDQDWPWTPETTVTSCVEEFNQKWQID